MKPNLTERLKEKLQFSQDLARDAITKYAHCTFRLEGFVSGLIAENERLSPIHAAMIDVIEAAKSVPDADYGELYDALQKLEQAISQTEGAEK